MAFSPRTGLTCLCAVYLSMFDFPYVCNKLYVCCRLINYLLSKLCFSEKNVRRKAPYYICNYPLAAMLENTLDSQPEGLGARISYTQHWHSSIDNECSKCQILSLMYNICTADFKKKRKIEHAQMFFTLRDPAVP